MKTIQYIVAKKMKDGTTRFTRSSQPEKETKYINRYDENDTLVYVPEHCEELYDTYIQCKHGLHHFYDPSMKSKFHSLEMEKRFCIPENSRDAAAKHYEKAAAALTEADEQEQRLTKLNEEIEQLKSDMDKADRDGYAALFGEW